MRYAFWLVLLALAFPMQAQAELPKNWAAQENFTPSKAEVTAFLLQNGGLTDRSEILCDYSFTRPANGEPYRLIVSIDASGRDFCNSITVYTQKNHRFEKQDFDAYEVNDLGAALIDLDHDGVQEMALPTLIYDPAKSEAEQCGAWTTVYQWSHGRFEDASARFPDFYRQRLAQLKTEHAAAPEHPECYMKEKERILKFLSLPR